MLQRMSSSRNAVLRPFLQELLVGIEVRQANELFPFLVSKTAIHKAKYKPKSTSILYETHYTPQTRNTSKR